MNNSVFAKTRENVKKPRDTKLIITEKRRSYLVSESNNHIKKFSSKDLADIEMK